MQAFSRAFRIFRASPCPSSHLRGVAGRTLKKTLRGVTTAPPASSHAALVGWVMDSKQTTHWLIRGARIHHLAWWSNWWRKSSGATLKGPSPQMPSKPTTSIPHPYHRCHISLVQRRSQVTPTPHSAYNERNPQCTALGSLEETPGEIPAPSGLGQSPSGAGHGCRPEWRLPQAVHHRRAGRCTLLHPAQGADPQAPPQCPCPVGLRYDRGRGRDSIHPRPIPNGRRSVENRFLTCRCPQRGRGPCWYLTSACIDVAVKECKRRRLRQVPHGPPHGMCAPTPYSLHPVKPTIVPP